MKPINCAHRQQTRMMFFNCKSTSKKLHGQIFLTCLVALLASVVSAQSTRGRTRKVPAKTSPAQIAPRLTEAELKQLDEAASQSRAKLIEASKTYHESLGRVIELQKKDEKRAADLVESRKQLLELGVVAKRQVDESQQELAAAQGRSAATQKQMEEIEQLIAEVNAAEELAKLPKAQPGVLRSSGLLIRYVGASRWNLSDFGKVDAFFRLKYKRPLPVSAFGQTETHNQLGFDHREAVDVAIHPDSAEGQALIAYLQTQGISFIAIRAAITGSATGAHIHIGPGSRRISPR